MLTLAAMENGDPFRVLIACILSLRTRDTTSGPAAARLFAFADHRGAMLKLSRTQIERAIYPVGFSARRPARSSASAATCWTDSAGASLAISTRSSRWAASAARPPTW